MRNFYFEGDQFVVCIALCQLSLILRFTMLQLFVSMETLETNSGNQTFMKAGQEIRHKNSIEKTEDFKNNSFSAC